MDPHRIDTAPTPAPAAHTAQPGTAAQPTPAIDRTIRPAADGPAEAEALLRLVLCAGPAAPRRALLTRSGGAQAALAAGETVWRESGLDAAQRRALRAPPDEAWARGRDWLADPWHGLIGWHSPDYPALLRRIDAPPLALFVAGDATLLWHPAVAVVGSRGPSVGGMDNAAAFSRALARAGFCVVSGLAAGIDRAAHEAALAVTPGRTVAVLGTGPDVPYPRSHAALHARVRAAGVVVSEHPPGTGPLRSHFPSRNRIIAGLALGTLVVEAATRSGALITARLAAEAGREVFALPGSIHNPLARGCHRLIRDGAALVETPEEVVESLGPCAQALATELRARLCDGGRNLPTADLRPGLTAPSSAGVRTLDRPLAAPPDGGPADSPDHQRLWSALGHDPTDMDGLVLRTGLTAAALSSMLLAMELQGHVVVAHGRYTRRTPPPPSAPEGASQGT